MDSNRRVLFIRLSAIGDVLLMTPLIRLLHEHEPKVKIDVLVKEAYAPLLQHHPLVDEVLTLPQPTPLAAVSATAKAVRQRSYWRIFDLQKHWRSFFVTSRSGAGRVNRYKKQALRRFLLVRFKQNYYPRDTVPMTQRYFAALHELEVPWRRLPLELHIPDRAKTAVAARWPFDDNETVIALAPGASRATKRWPPGRFVELVESLTRQPGYKVLLLGGREDEALCQQIAAQSSKPVINWSGSTSLLETAHILGKVALTVTHDTGVMHMAAAMQTRTVALFGPTVEPFGFFPYEVTHRVVEIDGLECRPCSYHGTESCPKGHFKCMKQIAPDQVLAAIADLLKEPVRSNQ